MIGSFSFVYQGRSNIDSNIINIFGNGFCQNPVTTGEIKKFGLLIMDYRFLVETKKPNHSGDNNMLMIIVATAAIG